MMAQTKAGGSQVSGQPEQHNKTIPQERKKKSAMINLNHDQFLLS